MKKTFVFVTSLIFLLTQPVFSQSVGTTSFEFLKSQYSARGAAMAGNLVAVSGDINAMFYNPAALSPIDRKEWVASYVDHLLDFQGGHLAYLTPFKSLGNLGLGLVYFNYGDFDETNEFGEQTGRKFSASEFAFAMSLSNVLGDNFDYGVNIKFIYSSLDTYNSSGLAVDAGIIYTVPKIQDLVIGFSVSNLGFTLSKYTQADQTFPLLMRFGIAKRLAHLPLLIMGSLNDLTLDTGDTWDIFRRFAIGGEFDVSEVIKLRLGYDNDINQNVKPVGGRGFGGLSAGLGINWNKFRLDYAYSAFGDVGSQNRITISGHF